MTDRDRTEVANRKSALIDCLVYRTEGAGPSVFFKQVKWQIGIKEGHFMNGGSIRKQLAMQYKRPLADVRLFAYSPTGYSQQVAQEKLEWLNNPQDQKLNLSDLNPTNLVYPILDKDRIALTPTNQIFFEKREVTTLLMAVANAQIFLQVSDSAGNLREDLLASASKLSQELAKLNTTLYQ